MPGLTPPGRRASFTGWAAALPHGCKNSVVTLRADVVPIPLRECQVPLRERQDVFEEDFIEKSLTQIYIKLQTVFGKAKKYDIKLRMEEYQANPEDFDDDIIRTNDYPKDNKKAKPLLELNKLANKIKSKIDTIN